MLLGTALMCPRFLQDTALIVFIKEQLECRHSSSRCEGHMVRRHTSSAVYHRACMLCGALCHFKEVYCVYCRLLSVPGHNVGQCAFLHNLKKKQLMMVKPQWKNIVLYLHAVNVTQHAVVCTLAFACPCSS